MRRVYRIVPMAAMAALVMASGCGTAGDFLLGALKSAAKDAIQTATSQAVETLTTEIETSLLGQISQFPTSSAPAS